ncbi:MAG: ABC transporter substrate-binding protein [Bacteroidales bacterium]|jgi:LysM repeat protein|nr:ABC transporter substrate-binding protein [Bacteroidales bacterium]
MKRKTIFFLFLFALLVVSSNAVFAQNNDESTYGWHNVEAGENLFRISRHYFLKEADIMEINEGLTAENLKAGQRIKIPLTVRNKTLLVTDEKVKPVNNHKPSSPANTATKKSYAKNKHLNIAMFLPLCYDRVSELDFTNFNINEKRKKGYKSLEYITFYEGARIALDRLEKDGYNVSLYVYDVGEDNVDDMKHTLNRKEMKDMDMLIPLVFRKPFDVCSEYAQQRKIPVVNPMSPNLSILNNNYVFKMQPSAATDVETVMRYIRSHYSTPNITLIHSNTAEEKPIVTYYKQLFESSDIPWTIIDYNKYAARITEKVVKSRENIVISLVRKSNDTPDEAYISTLLSKLNDKKDCNITLFGSYDWLSINSIDFSLLQRLNFHFLLSYLNDYSNANFVDFVKDYRYHFKGEPDKIYASLGYDIISYFVPALIDCGDSFMDNPNTTKANKMINPFYFERRDENSGYQNKRTIIYNISDYKIISVGR